MILHQLAVPLKVPSYDIVAQFSINVPSAAVMVNLIRISILPPRSKPEVVLNNKLVGFGLGGNPMN